MFLNTFLFLISIIIVYLYWFYKNAFRFFAKRNIAYVQPDIIFGNLTEVIFKKKTLFEVYAEIYQKIKPQKIGGFFHLHRPTYIVCDPELIKNITIKNFEHFTRRRLLKPGDSTGTSRVSLMRGKIGEKWKNFRMKQTPAFSSGKLKMMFALMKVCSNNLVRVLEQFTTDEEIEYKCLFARYSTDVAATCAFGVEMNTLENPKSEMFQLSRQYRRRSFLKFLLEIIPNKLTKLKEIILSYVTTERLETYYHNLVLETIKHRETNKIVRNDYLDSLIRQKNNSAINKYLDEHDAKNLKTFSPEIGDNHNIPDIEITDGIVVEQVFFFLATNLNLTSNALSCSLLELALNPEIQNKVRNEITAILKNSGDELTYEVMKQMKYTDMVIAETFRKHPPIAKTGRICTSDYNVPGTKIIIKKGETVVIPTYGLHMDKEYYEKPDEFCPDHFTAEAIARRSPFSYLPFGEGPRMCVASRFAKMSVKMALIYMLKNHSFSLSPRTKIPIQYKRKVIQRNHLLEVDGGIWLKCEKI